MLMLDVRIYGIRATHASPLQMRVPSLTILAEPRLPVSTRLGQLKLRAVDKTFANSSIHALRDITLTCEPGEFVVVVGPSGCGKSTLLNIAAGMVTPDAGEVLLDGHAISGPGP